MEPNRETSTGMRRGGLQAARAWRDTVQRAQKITLARLRRAAEAEGMQLPGEPVTAREALRAIRPSICARVKDSTNGHFDAAWAQLEGELENSLENEAIVVEHARTAWLPSLPDAALNGDAWSWLKSIRSADERARVCEQMASLRAHPSHPMARMRFWDDREPGARQPLAPSCLRKWSPEWRPTVRVQLLALRTSHAAVVEGKRARELGGACGYVRAHFPAQYGAWEAALQADGLDPAEYTPLPTHPSNLQHLRSHQAHLIRERVLALLPAGDEAEVGGVAIPSTPMMSFRTVLPLRKDASGEDGTGGGTGEAGDGAQPHALPPPSIKMCCPVLITSLLRYLSPVEASEGPVFSELLCALVERTPDVRAVLAIAAEELSVFLWDGDPAVHLHNVRTVRNAADERTGAAAVAAAAAAEAAATAAAEDEAENARAAQRAQVASCSYEEGRFVSALFRASPQALPPSEAAAGTRVLHVPLATLLASPTVGCGEGGGERGSGAPVKDGLPLLAELALRHGDGARGYYRAYASVVLRGALGLYARFGVGLELHQQNSLLELRPSDGLPLRLVCREVAGGVYIDHAAFTASVSARVRGALHRRQDAMVGFELAFANFFHSTIAMHLLQAGDCISRASAAAGRGAGGQGLSPSEVREDVRDVASGVLDQVDAEFERMPPGVDADTLQAHALRVRARLFDAELAPRKGLLLMRLMGTRAEKYVLGPNPLYSGLQEASIKRESVADTS